MVGLIILIALILFFIAGLFVKYDAITKTNALDRLKAPSWKYPFGTDTLGRNLFLRVMYGTRYSLAIGFGCTIISLALGVILGGISGYYGNMTDNVIMRATDVVSSIPGMLSAMVIMTALGQSLANMIFAMGITGVPMYIRITRAQVLTVRTNEYVEAARAIGISNFKIILKQIIPNSMSPIIVTVTSGIGMTIMAASGLSFIGFGVPSPKPEWGALVSNGRDLMRTSPWVTTFPGAAIMLIVLAFSILGDGLRDALDPKLKT